MTAKGFNGGAGIGGGVATSNGEKPGTCGTVTISGGTVTAIGGEGAAGIGGGRAYGLASPGNNGGTIIITGGNVTARTTYHATYGGGYGIGHGYAGNSTGLTADIRLSYTAASNSINAEGYTGAVTITDSKTMSDGTDTYTGVLTSDEITAIAGKTLTAPTYGVTANSANGNYWTTFYHSAAGYSVDANTTAFIASLSGTTLTLTPIDGGIIPADKAVVLKSSAEGITLTRTDATSSFDFTANSLLGTMTRIENPGNAYVLNKKESHGVGFYRLSDSGHIGACKAYLTYSGSANAREFFGFSEATAIETVAQPSDSETVGAWYTLSGVRLQGKPTQSGMYIHNGRKEVLK